MTEMTIDQIVQATQGILLQPGQDAAPIVRISTDSRQIPEQCLFVPLSGERFDGHTFLRQAAENGAAAVLTHQAELAEGLPLSLPVVQVMDTKLALGDLARFCRSAKPSLFCVGVTGSVGKTSTKEMTAQVLSVARRTQKTPYNYNNEIGLPMTILTVEDAECLVLEMGMRGRGQIAYLTKIAQPDLGIITNIGTSHLELLKSRTAIFEAKMELCAGLSDTGTLLLNGDDAFLSRRDSVLEQCGLYGKKPRLLTFGLGEACDVRAVNREEREDGSVFLLVSPWGDTTVRLRVLGEHAVRNALAAAGAGLCAGLSLEQVREGLESYGDQPLRQTILKAGNITLIDDTYNASPESMKATLLVLKQLKKSCRRVAILGDMFELGEQAASYHRQVGEYAKAAGIDCLIAAGELARFYGEGFGREACFYAADAEEAAEQYLKIQMDGDCVLVKGSHGMHMEKAVAKIQEGMR